MIEKTLLDFLNEKLDVPAAMEIPKDAPDSFVVIQKSSSSEQDFVQHATMALQSYASTLYKAAALNEAVKEAMKDFHSLDGISGVYLSTDYNYTDTVTKHYRYQATYDIFYF